jgi:hypothetical protein
MIATNFTPGPWSVLTVDQVPTGYWSVANCGGPHAENATARSVLVIAPIKDYCKAAEDDARLIAAAPELYSQLEFAVKLLEGQPGFAGSPQVESMRAVLAKVAQP